MKPQKKKSKKKYGESIPIAWYTSDQWELLRQAAKDGESLEATYEEWRDHADDAVRILTTSGYRVKIVDVDVPELIAWCKHQRRLLDSEARADFIVEKMEERPRKKEQD